MFDLTARQKDILVIARSSGRVDVDDLVGRFNVSPQTIRKDLNDLCERHQMSRVHGGAVLTSSVENIAYEARRHISSSAKTRIGAAAAALVPSNSSLFLAVGTTTESVAICLSEHDDLLVITNNLNVAMRLYPHHGQQVIVASGSVRKSDGAIIGSAAVDFIKQFRFDTAIIGVSAIDTDGALLDFDYQEVRVNQTIIENARRVILVADHTKLDRAAPVRIGHIGQMDVFVTDVLHSDALRQVLVEHGVELVEVGE